MKPRRVLARERAERAASDTDKKAAKEYGLTRQAAIASLNTYTNEAGHEPSNVYETLPTDAYGAALAIAETLDLGPKAVTRAINESGSAYEFWANLGYRYQDSDEENSHYLQDTIENGLREMLKDGD